MKKVVIIVLILIVGLFSFLWWLGGRVDQSALSFKTIARPDSDGDGLADWEELEWRTNPNNPDTDGDGTKDGAEIAAGRDPLVPSQNGLSDRLADPNARLQALVRNAVANQAAPLETTAGPLPALLVYKAADLKLDQEESAAQLSAYGANIKAALSGFTARQPGTEAAQLIKYLDSGDRQALAAIASSRGDYADLLAKLAAINVPPSAASLQLGLLNRVAYLTQLVFLMAQVENQPLLATRAAQDQPPKFLELIDYLRQLDAYFAERHIK